MVNPVLATNSSTSSLSELMLSQVAIQAVDKDSSQITVYASLLDVNKNPIQSVKTKEVNVTLDGRELAKDAVTEVKTFQETGEGIAYTLLLDVSKTMKGPPFLQAQEATKRLIKQMRQDPADWVAVITFGDEVTILSDFANVSQQDKVIKQLDKLEAIGDNTHLYQAILNAFSLNKRIDSRLPVRRALFVITDGKDEGSGIQPSDLEPAINRNSVPIYSVGYTRIEKTYLDSIKRLAKLSGGNFVDKSTAPQDFPGVYEKTMGDILKQLVIRATVSPGLKADGYNHSVKVTVSQGRAKIYGEKTVAFLHESDGKVEGGDTPDPPPPNPPEPPSPPQPNFILASNPSPPEDYQWGWGWYVLPGIVMTIVLSLVWFKLRNKPAADTSGQMPEPIPITPTTSKVMLNTVKTPKLGPHFQVQFLVIEGPQTGKQMLFPIDERGITIGRQGADLVVNDSQIAKVHCVVQKRNKRLVVKNVEANRETFINGIPVSQKDVLDNDNVILLGETKIRARILK
jgi:uncharacterized protein YegL